MSQGNIPHPVAETQTGDPRRPVRVLVIDDEESILKVIKLALTKYGCDVETAGNGRQGLQALLRRTFDVAVVDVRMQEMDGLAFIQEARKIWPWLGVVLYSGFLDERIMEIARSEGVQNILTKPVDMRQLSAAVYDEAARRDARERSSSGTLPMSLISYQLNMMRHITQDTLHARNLLAALTNLGRTISEMMPCHMLGILALEEEEQVVLLQNTIALPASFADEIKNHMVGRYHALSGKTLRTDALRIEHLGPVSDNKVMRGFHSIASVPVLMGDEVHGILTLASCAANAFTDTQISLLYHAAGNLSTLLGALAEMRRLAVRDPLTGIYNRLQMEEELEKFWSLATRYKKSMAVLLLDIDHFKSINDMGGHNRGDGVLREFAHFLKSATRTSDIVARYGGDEFIIILPYADAREATNLAHRLISSLRTQRFLEAGNPVTLSTSIGIAVHDPLQHPLRKEQLIDFADRAMYQAKKDGRDRFHLFSSMPGGTAAASTSAAKSGLIIPAGTARKGLALIVDDEIYIQQILRHILEGDGYEVVTTSTINEARAILEDHAGRIDLLLSDLSLPDGDGHDLVKWVRDNDRLMVAMVISGHVTADNAILALRNGAFDFIQKPIIQQTLLAQVERAMKYRHLQRENARYHVQLEDMVRAKSAELSGALEDIKAAYEYTLETMVAMLDAREFETGQHSLRVRDLTVVLARAMGVDGKLLEEIGRGALLHDIGKIGIPDSILLKPGKLTEEEWDVMRKHPEIGHRFLTNSAFLQTAADLVLSHHERWDGAGYPHGLSGPQINLGARIFAVIDAYDAMRSPRIYKDAVSMEKAVAEIRNKAGAQFDPEVVAVFLKNIAEIEQVGRWSPPLT